MELLYPFFVAFILVFVSELGDKTQLLVLSFSNKTKSSIILLGVALGSFFSHGVAILFGSSISLLENEFLHTSLEILTYSSFILFGILSFFNKKEDKESSKKESFIKKLSRFGFGYIFIIAFSIAIGELGDKTFLASIGLGISYPYSKLFLISGAILGMIVSDSIAIVFGKFLNKYISESTMQKLSGSLFLIFGIIGFVNFIF
ncbi:MAG: TMEM165/GDT1 family protein [Clostridiaceae bacterium]|nr:TMEM165/GDT1 family protein [Clostridiaceae bacterium]